MLEIINLDYFAVNLRYIVYLRNKTPTYLWVIKLILIYKIFNTYFFEKSIEILQIIIMHRHTYVYKTRLLLKAQKSIIEIFRCLFSFMHRLFIRKRSIERSMKIKSQFLPFNKEFEEPISDYTLQIHWLMLDQVK